MTVLANTKIDGYNVAEVQKYWENNGVKAEKNSTLKAELQVLAIKVKVTANDIAFGAGDYDTSLQYETRSALEILLNHRVYVDTPEFSDRDRIKMLNTYSDEQLKVAQTTHATDTLAKIYLVIRLPQNS